MLETGPSFVLKISLSLQKEEDFQKQINNKNDPILELKTGPILLRNILGPIFSASLDQLLTLGFLFLRIFLFFLGGGGGLNPYFCQTKGFRRPLKLFDD